jgi:hypothetical protein
METSEKTYSGPEGGQRGAIAKRSERWDENNVEGRLEILRAEVRYMRGVIETLAASLTTVRLQVQNHSHTPMGQPNFPAAVFERGVNAIGRRDPLE